MGDYSRGDPYRAYDVSPDGKRFLMILDGGASGDAASAASIIVVLNWFEELKRLCPAGRN